MPLGYYPGCSGEGSGIEYKLSTEKTAEMLGIELQELEDWNCCGATSAHNTNKLLSLALPARNLAIAERMNLDTILAPCAACYNRHRATEVQAQEDNEIRLKLQEIIDMDFKASSRTVSVLEWLVKDIGIDSIKEKITKPLKGMKAACYYGCLLVRPEEYTGFDDNEDPQTMDQIVKAAGAEAVDWAYKTECCGASLATSRPEIGAKMIYDVIQNARQAGAECIVTACPLCMLNLDMRQAGAEKQYGVKLNMPIYYVTELVALAGGYGHKEVGVPRHFVEAASYLESLPAKAAAIEAAEAEEAAKKVKPGKKAAAPTGTEEDEAANQKKITAMIKGFEKNPDKMAARIIEDEERAKVLAEIVVGDEKKISKLAELMVTDPEKAFKVADAFVTGELKKRAK
ncbi:cob--com heterodisulfide reductase subunit b [hydrocarbon metagenome]|uniref:Cob--com heterodisulfide reductase subunit b n=1 Tax=hydrocarbon metagenome TaxID=938273 RepID=A0A0W8E773_9ZZZZ